MTRPLEVPVIRPMEVPVIRPMEVPVIRPMEVPVMRPMMRSLSSPVMCPVSRGTPTPTFMFTSHSLSRRSRDGRWEVKGLLSAAFDMSGLLLVRDA